MEEIHTTKFSQDQFSALKKGLKSFPKINELKAFVLSQYHQDGGFKNPAGEIDVFSTAYGIMLAKALDIDFKESAIIEFLDSIRNYEKLEFIHLTHLCKAWAFLTEDALAAEEITKICAALEMFRVQDHGYSLSFNAKASSIYGTYLGFEAYQNLGREIPNEVKALKTITDLRSRDGQWATDKDLAQGNASSTNFAMSLLHALEDEVPAINIDYLLSQEATKGGFLASAAMPFSDMQTTAIALQNLHYQEKEIDKEKQKNFLQSLINDNGSIKNHERDENPSLESTFYGLVTLGLIA